MPRRGHPCRVFLPGRILRQPAGRLPSRVREGHRVRLQQGLHQLPLQRSLLGVRCLRRLPRSGNYDVTPDDRHPPVLNSTIRWCSKTRITAPCVRARPISWAILSSAAIQSARSTRSAPKTRPVSISSAPILARECAEWAPSATSRTTKQSAAAPKATPDTRSKAAGHSIKVISAALITFIIVWNIEIFQDGLTRNEYNCNAVSVWVCETILVLLKWLVN